MKRIDLVVTIHLPPPFPLLSRKGTGCCSKCATLTRNAEDAVKAMGINASVEEVTDIEKIISYGIMRTPALAVVETNGRNVCGSIAIFDFDTDSGVFACDFGANSGLWSVFKTWSKHPSFC